MPVCYLSRISCAFIVTTPLHPTACTVRWLFLLLAPVARSNNKINEKICPSPIARSVITNCCCVVHCIPTLAGLVQPSRPSAAQPASVALPACHSCHSCHSPCRPPLFGAFGGTVLTYTPRPLATICPNSALLLTTAWTHPHQLHIQYASITHFFLIHHSTGSLSTAVTQHDHNQVDVLNSCSTLQICRLR